MANLSKTKVFSVSLVMFLVLVVISEAQVSAGIPAALAEKIDSKLILRKLGYDVSKLERYGRKLMLGSGTQRVSPGGPDSQHHSLPPALS
ncbi:hypothetical protein Pint_04688 [Pistacia integerrima]|uniref:Uncharacterized protein n=1 Tax=Pistacia integerrima TaxID=434235 RepID=A0ACC0Z7J5_9ROSI|nr:hypothetical protein Pint_04688 [Pistacia integerrima]